MQDIKQQLKQLYRDAFEATEDYVDFFFSEYVKIDDAVMRYDGDKVVSVAYIINKPFVLQGKEISLAFLSSISTAPELRGKRLVEQVIRQAFERVALNGQYLIALFPFKQDYYRKYGFVSAINTKKEKISFCGEVPTRIEAKTSILSDIYDKYCKNFDSYLLRTEHDWNHCLTDWSSSGDFVEVYEKGDKRCYISYGKEGVNEAAGELTLLNGVSHLQGLTIEKFGTEIQGTMFRVIDIKSALENTVYIADGVYNFSLVDTFLPQNSRNYKLEVKKGIGKVTLSDTVGESITIEQLTQAIIGEKCSCGLESFVARQKIFCLDKY